MATVLSVFPEDLGVGLRNPLRGWVFILDMGVGPRRFEVQILGFSVPL